MKLLVTLLFGAALIAGCAAPALASPQHYQDEQDRQRNTQAYSAGYTQGQADAHSHAVRNDQATTPWVRDDDQRAYRQGYDAGYDSAVRNESNAAAPAALPHGDQQATQFGYQDGLAAGRYDQMKGKQFKPEDHDLYKSGTHGWEPSLGTKEQFKQLYREAFVRGYQEGFRGTGPK